MIGSPPASVSTAITSSTSPSSSGPRNTRRSSERAIRAGQVRGRSRRLSGRHSHCGGDCSYASSPGESSRSSIPPLCQTDWTLLRVAELRDASCRRLRPTQGLRRTRRSGRFEPGATGSKHAHRSHGSGACAPAGPAWRSPRWIARRTALCSQRTSSATSFTVRYGGAAASAGSEVDAFRWGRRSSARVDTAASLARPGPCWLSERQTILRQIRRPTAIADQSQRSRFVPPTSQPPNAMTRPKGHAKATMPAVLRTADCWI
jgi:hypothetical protein